MNQSIIIIINNQTNKTRLTMIENCAEEQFEPIIDKPSNSHNLTEEASVKVEQ
jgi:hypothetical protein